MDINTIELNCNKLKQLTDIAKQELDTQALKWKVSGDTIIEVIERLPF